MRVVGVPPRASRVAQLASGGRKSLAQSIFQVGGNGGSAFGPLAAALVVLPHGQGAIGWFAVAALLAILVLVRIGGWYRDRLDRQRQSPAAVAAQAPAPAAGAAGHGHPHRAGVFQIHLQRLHDELLHLLPHGAFRRFGAGVAGCACSPSWPPLPWAHWRAGCWATASGRKYVIWGSIFGAAPFALLLPYANLFWTIVLAVVVGLVIASAFSAILVYATDLMPGKVGLVSGLFFGLMFGLGGGGFGPFRLAGRPHEHRVRLPSQFVVAPAGAVAGFLPDVRPTADRRNSA